MSTKTKNYAVSVTLTKLIVVTNAKDAEEAEKHALEIVSVSDLDQDTAEAHSHPVTDEAVSEYRLAEFPIFDAMPVKDKDKFTIRVPHKVKSILQILAESAGVSLEEYVTGVLNGSIKTKP